MLLRTITLLLVLASVASRDMTPAYVAFIVLVLQEIGNNIEAAIRQQGEGR